ncbi:MAG: hypothetical protein AMXMBFR80_25450 [Dehalococcoidia bacterium]
MRSWTFVASLLAALGGPLAAAHAQPSVPSSFYGSVTLDGEAAPDGTEVRALIDGVDCTQAAPGERPAIRQGNATAYVVHVVHESQRPGCGREGKTVSFTIAGRPALQHGVWKAGPQQVDLSAGSAEVVPLPTFTPAIPGTPSSGAGAVSTPTALVRPSGTPPMDDVQLPGTASPPATASPPGPGDSPDDPGASGGGPAWVALAAVAGLLVAGGTVGGVVLARRRGPSRAKGPS